MKIYIIGANQKFLKNIQDALVTSGNKDCHILVSPKISVEELHDKASDCEILVAGQSGFEYLSKKHIDTLPKLKFISTITVGVNWIDLQAAKERGIIVSNQKGVNAESVAEHCFAMILDLSKKIAESDRGIREKGDNEPYPYMGRELFGKTIGIIGTGDIGQKVARVAKGFSMKVLGVNKSRREIAGIKIVSKEILLKESNVIVVTVPLTTETENFLSEKEFKMMKNGVILVSISREKIINRRAVLKALDSEKIFGFGFDMDMLKPIEKNDPFLKMEQVIITPHSASFTIESDKRYAEMTVENVSAFLNEKPIRIVSK